MFAKDQEIFVAIIASTALMVFLVAVIVFAVIRYQNKLRKHLQEISDMRIAFHSEVLKAQLEKEEQTLLRISQEIHDNIGQILSLVKLNLNTMDISSCTPTLQEKVILTKDMVGKAINDLRQLSKSLNSTHLKQQFLSESLKAELDIINKVGLYLTSFSINGEEKLLDPQKQLIIFRMVQEALNNIIKHAQAKQISITLNYEFESLYLSIADDGIGLSEFNASTTNSPKKGTGMGNLYYRAELIGAIVNIESEKNKGTNIQFTIPYNQKQT